MGSAQPVAAKAAVWRPRDRYLRFGGTGNDKLIYGVGNITKCSLNAEHCLIESQFDDFMGLAAASKA